MNYAMTVEEAMGFEVSDDWCDVGCCNCYDQPRTDCYKCKFWLEEFGIPIDPENYISAKEKAAL